MRKSHLKKRNKFKLQNEHLLREKNKKSKPRLKKKISLDLVLLNKSRLYLVELNACKKFTK